MAKWASKKILVTVRTYPTPARKGIETSCTVGVTESGDWIRLHPIPYRYMEDDQRFVKYQWIEARVRKASDHRRESYTPDLDTIQVISGTLGTERNWAARREIVEPLLAESMCALQRQGSSGPTLGLVRPREITRLRIRPDKPDWTPNEQRKLQQRPLDGPVPKQLEKIPFKFSYEYLCADASCIKGHKQRCTDWEMLQAYRSWRQRYGEDWEGPFRNRFEREMIEKLDTHFYVGTHSQFPTWMVVGLFYPPRVIQSSFLSEL